MLGSTRAALLRPDNGLEEGDIMGSSSSLSAQSAARILSRFSSRLGSWSGMIVAGLDWTLLTGTTVGVSSLTVGGCMVCTGCRTTCCGCCWGLRPVVSTVLRVETGAELATTITFCLVTACCCCCCCCWALFKAANSSSCKGTGVKAYELINVNNKPPSI